MATVRRLLPPVGVVVALFSFAAIAVFSYAISVDREVGASRPPEALADEPAGLTADQADASNSDEEAGSVATGFDSALDQNGGGPNTVSTHFRHGTYQWEKDSWATVGGGESFMTIGSPNIPAIPAGFFYPGSQPFMGTIQLNEDCNHNGIDDTIDLSAGTVVQRYGDPPSPTAPNGAVQTMPIEIAALCLTSASPITVTGGPQNTLWNVSVTLSDVHPPQGLMTATKTHNNGGTYDCFLYVQPKLTFTRLGTGDVRVLDTGEGGNPPLTFASTGNHYVYRVNPALALSMLDNDTGAIDFVRWGVHEVTPGDLNSQVIAPSTLFDPLANTQHTVEPPRPPDPHATPRNNNSFVTFGSPDIPPIPAGFFYPGSNPFTGMVAMGGGGFNEGYDGAGNTTAKVDRHGNPVSPSDPNGTVGTTPIEIVALSLVSTSPITVSGGGPNTQWHVQVDLSANPAPQGSLTATKTHANGGTFDAALFVQPRFAFTQLGDPSQVRVLDTGLQGIQPLNFTTVGNHFVFDANDALGVVTPHDGRFVAGVREVTPGNPASQVSTIGTFNDPGAQTQHQIEPPKKPDPHGTRGGAGQTFAGFGVGTNPAIPADFFFPGSLPFSGTLTLAGEGEWPCAGTLEDCGNISARIVRPGPPVLPSAPNGTMGTVPIEIVSLSLVSVNPILVGATQWDVRVGLSSIPAPVGSLTATKTHANGGTFTSTLRIQPRFTFTQVGNPNEIRVLDTGLEGIPPIQFSTAPVNGHFVFNLNPQLGTIAPYDGTFVPGVQEQTPGNPASQRFVQTIFNDPPGPTRHTVDPPTPPDPHATPRGFSFNGFGLGGTPAIPAGFFGPGSDPFLGSIQWQGHRIDQETLGNTSTLVQRSGMPVSPQAPIGAQGTVDLEMVALSLVSTQPIMVTYNGGNNPERWQVALTGGPVDNQPGQLTATKTHPNGGTFDAILPVQPVFTFVKVQPQPEPPAPPVVRVLDSEAMGFPPAILQASGEPFVHVLNPALNILAPSRGTFVPGVRENTPGDLNSQAVESAQFNDPAGPTFHTVDPPRPEPEPDPHATIGGPSVESSVVFGGGSQPAIPADFFGPGSDPFTGTVSLEGFPPDPANDISTLIQRSAHPIAPSALPGANGQVEIEIVSLSLVSVSGILVTSNGGQNPQAWGIRVELSDVPSPPGQLMATKTHPNGGTFDTTLPVQPKFTFTKIASPNQGQMRVLDTGGEGIPPILFSSSGTPWVHTLGPDLAPLLIAPSNGNFVPGVQEVNPGNPSSQQTVPMEEFDPNGPTRHTVEPPRPAGVCACDADVDNNTFVNAIDLAMIIDCINGVPSCTDPNSRDVNCDGTVDHADLGVALHQFRGMPGDGCDVPTGACCQTNGNCLHEQQSLCAGDPLFPQYAGVYQGDGTDCDPNPCGLAPPTVGDDTCQTSGADLGTPCSTNADCPAAGSACGNKSRYVSITPTNAAVAGGTSIQVEVVSCPQFPAIVGDIFYAGVEQAVPNAPNPALRGAPLQCTVAPNSQTWSAGAVHLWGQAVVPGSTYNVRMCDAAGGNCSSPLLVATGKWGDVIRAFGGGSQPNFADINSIVQKFAGLASAPSMPRADLAGVGNPGNPNTPNQVANFQDVSNDVSAFSGFPYPFTVTPCP